MTSTNENASTSADHTPGDIEALLPWYATGTLNARDARRVEEALAADPALARQFEAVVDEHAETILLNESLGAPSARAMEKLLAVIDAEPVRASHSAFNPLSRLGEWFGRMSPRTLAWSGIAGAVLILLQAGVIGGALLMKQTGFQTASYETPATGAASVLISFKPDAQAADISSFLETYRGSIVSGPNVGMFRVRLGDKALSKQEASDLISRLQTEKVVNFVVATE